MAKKRYVDTKFWDDGYIVECDPIEKLLYLYLLSNTLTNICGIYEISLRRIAFDTGIDKDMVLKILERFEIDGKIKYQNGWIAIKNFIKYQMDNPKIRAGISYELKTKPISLVGFVETLDYIPKEKEFKRKKIRKTLRDKILKRDNYKCCFCNSTENLEIDHIIPVFQGGTNIESNLRVLCQSCNGKRNAGLRWNKEKNGWAMDNVPKKMGGLSHLNPNTNLNPNINTNSNTNDNTNQPSFEKDGAVYQLTIYLDGKIRENNTAVKKRDEKQIQSWCKDMDKLIRIDHAKPNDIKKVIDWVVEDNFWSPNILSAIKLRKHYSRFYKKVIDRGRSLEEKLKVDHRFDNLK